ncbi:hypothetical protein BB561_000204 [Smittium simulii]|uniref:Uncharacterized protein n=1 Tax=Smittium simulii TaxID=133385 RepID=A0A2T9Z056_9FUNG|nr:hypothetical protein BB561_000204 [Smittium simulii]
MFGRYHVVRSSVTLQSKSSTSVSSGASDFNGANLLFKLLFNTSISTLPSIAPPPRATSVPLPEYFTCPRAISASVR